MNYKNVLKQLFFSRLLIIVCLALMYFEPSENNVRKVFEFNLHVWLKLKRV